MSPNIPTLTLNDGTTLPALGFGTSPMKGSSAVEAITAAIHNGYRLLDSAFNYENEGALGAAIRKSGIAREQLRLCSKLPGRHHKYEQAIAAVEESLWRAGLDYYDLYLIHWPNPLQDLYVEAWRAMIEVQKRGLVRSIGVSNFLPAHLDRLKQETGILPAVNQVEIHPYFPQEEQLAYNHAQGIVTESWSPFGRGTKIMTEPVVADIATKIGKTPAQVILRWHLQRGALPLPKASSPKRQQENLAVFDFTLDDADLAAMTALGRPDGRLQGQDPARYEEF
ncbi:aldo/keto reductase [Martelella sp. HB161492]|uniref:aldo/keto reductase n=1 Tax=Martelella sp. HB161492 TaxID=2720726 RepID=UPI0015901370|nr:aldo/keto reductase [Martelella sp. HB161492]